MLEEVFQDVYTKFKLHFYQNVFQRFATREATLTTVESFCMEGIMAMGEPTIAEFSRMMGISTPNAAYKIGSLVKKGYVEKIQSTTDRREYFLRPTQKYIDYYSISYSYLHTVNKIQHNESPRQRRGLSPYPIKAKRGRPAGTGQPQLHGNVKDRACLDVGVMRSPVQHLQRHAC